MAEGDDGQEKTEEPTQKRREQAREDGSIVTSKEVFVFATLAGGLALFMMIEGLLPALVRGWSGYLVIEPGADLERIAMLRLGQAWRELLIAGLVVSVPLLALVLLVQQAMGGITFSTKALGFKASRINPAAGLKRMVSLKALVELGKAVAKVALLIGVAVLVLRDELSPLDRLWTAAPGDAAAVLGAGLIRLVSALLLVLAVIGGLDLVWQAWSLTHSMKMSRQELKEESKEANGSPEVKGRMRRMQMEASRNGARRRAALDDVPKATAIVTNPTHFAVALRYVPGETQAPVILALGKGPMALDIVERGRKAGVGTLRIPLLARALYFTGDIGQEIPDGLYGAVAVVLAHVYRLDRGEAADLPEIDVPEDLAFDEFGRPM
ncbi:flagellar biosynthesis protein FlhB [Cereibacter johrii]|uniref:Flagellar biosynthetic protein FlhB n=1 Tax=Cereibacter johrii TaxID=445629 RepID=A0ABX5JG16_9RHOB|nr:flagellar biosynthesis protein FlhB [Cereibacter johrii]ODM41890.1 flagellar biosynthesis protein FlhB [Cereibacter johrii]PTM80314.1 flagellar biosynthetic protein FlhB [Cereibacter johrii]RAZ83672.1 flagellar biosynthesis protein FlhB [Cereibacter johrii]